MNTIITDDETWVYGYDLENKLFRHFSYNENPKRALHTTSMKCCLPSTDAIDRREKFTHAYFIEIHQVFAKKKKKKFGNFSNRPHKARLG